MYMDDAPFEVIDMEVAPCDDQIGGDVIDAASKVRFTVAKVSVRKNKDIVSLNVQAKVGPLGTNGDGKYSGKVLFGEMIIDFDKDQRTSDWWKKQARFTWKQFMSAMALDPKAPPRINDTFLTSLNGMDFIADIKKAEIRVKGSDGTYAGTGDFKNELANYKKAN